MAYWSHPHDLFLPVEVPPHMLNDWRRVMDWMKQNGLGLQVRETDRAHSPCAIVKPCE